MSAGVADAATEDIWNNIKTGLLKTTVEVGGTTQSHRWRRETWWWNEHVEKAIAAKRKAFKAWKTGKGARASFYAAKCIARNAVHHARQEADVKVYQNIDPKSSEVYRLANQFRRENADVVGDKRVKNDAREMSTSENLKESTTTGFSMLSLTGTKTTCLLNHQWKAHLSLSPFIWLRRLSFRWRLAKHQGHEA